MGLACNGANPFVVHELPRTGGIPNCVSPHFSEGSVMKRTIILLTLLVALPAFGATITSTTNGGNWEDAATWIGNVVPGATDDVVIDGTVSVTNSASTCNALTINAGKVVLKAGGSTGTIRGTVSVQTNATLQCDVNDALGWGSARVSTLNVYNGSVVHAASGFLPLWGMTINLFGARLEATAAGGVLDLGTDSNAANTPTAVYARAHPVTSVISAPLIRLRQTSTYFTVEDGAADVDLQLSAPISSITANSGILKSGAGCCRASCPSWSC